MGERNRDLILTSPFYVIIVVFHSIEIIDDWPAADYIQVWTFFMIKTGYSSPRGCWSDETGARYEMVKGQESHIDVAVTERSDARDKYLRTEFSHWQNPQITYAFYMVP